MKLAALWISVLLALPVRGFAPPISAPANTNDEAGSRLYLPLLALETGAGGTSPTDAGCVVVEQRDYQANGNVDRIDRTQYDLWANPIREERDTDADGVVEVERRWQYNDVGDLLETSWSTPAGRPPAPVWRYEYNTTRELIRWVVDSAGSGAEDRVVTYEYDSLGRRVAVRADNDGDGLVDAVSAFSYNGPNLVRVEVDRDANGIIDQIENRTWRGRLLIRQEFDLGGDGGIDRITVSEYDQNARLIARLQDQNADGRSDYDQFYTYNSLSQLIRKETYREGGLAAIESLTYDPSGRLVLEEIVTLSSNDSIRYSYECAVISE